MGRRGCCTGFLCISSRKRGKQIVPASRMLDGSSLSRQWTTNGPSPSGVSSQYASVSPSLLAPPSSPVSFQNSAVQSSAQSPSAFSATQAVPCSTSQIPLETAATMFQMGPYAHETALVSPPVFSTFTTAPSSAPFTPPPELATHLTTPSSPEVPFAQLLASSLGTKASVRLQPPPPYPASPFTSPDIFAADDLQGAYQLYPGSPLAHLISPASGTGESTPVPDLEISSQFTPFPDLENSVQVVATMFFPGSPLVTPDGTSSIGLEVESPLSRSLNSCSFREFRHEERLISTAVSSVLPRRDNTSGQKFVDRVEYGRGETFDNVNKGRDGCQKSKIFRDAEYTRNSGSLNEKSIDGSPGDSGSNRAGFSGVWSDHLQRQQDIHEPDQADRNTSRITVTCCAQTVMKTIHEGKCKAECAESLVESETHSLKFKPRLLDQYSDGNIVGGILSLEKSPTKVIISKHALMEGGRTENCIQKCLCATSVSGASLVTRFTIGGNCVRSQHVPVSPAKGRLDTTIVQQTDSRDRKVEAELNNGEQSSGCSCGCGKLDKICEELMKQGTGNLSGIEMDRVAMTREQHCKVNFHTRSS